MSSSARVSMRARHLRIAFLTLAGLCTLGTWHWLRAELERHAGQALWASGARFSQALSVSTHEQGVDWEAVERDALVGESSSANDAAVTSNAPSSAVTVPKVFKQKSQTKGPKGVYVSAEQVLRLSKVAKVPASRFVEGKGERPSGLQVAGVSGLGIGVRDGDVLTQVAGASVTSSAAVIATVLQLRGKHAPAISGEFWRGQERFQIVFQMPYVEAAVTPSGSIASAMVSSAGPKAPSSSAGSSN